VNETSVSTRSESVRRAVAGHFDAGPLYRTIRPGRQDLLLFVTIAGAGRFRNAGKTYTTVAGEAALYLPGTAQDYGTCPEQGRWVFRYAHALPPAGWQTLLRWNGPWRGLGIVRLDEPHALREATAALRRAEALTPSAVSVSAELCQNAVEAALLWCTSRRARAGRPAVDERVMLASEHARRHLDRPVRVAEMADAAAVSVPRLTALFRESLGISPARHAEQLRLAHADHLLRTTGMPAKQIAAACGFYDAAHFSKRFKQAYARPPRRRSSPRPATAINAAAEPGSGISDGANAPPPEGLTKPSDESGRAS
jgi:AraC family transcriptional regulator of arabinose operon